MRMIGSWMLFTAVSLTTTTAFPLSIAIAQPGPIARRAIVRHHARRHIAGAAVVGGTAGGAYAYGEHHHRRAGPDCHEYVEEHHSDGTYVRRCRH